MNAHIICSVCGGVMVVGTPAFDERHYYHSADCPNRPFEISGIAQVQDCICDNPCHAYCCPVCNRKEAEDDPPHV